MFALLETKLLDVSVSVQKTDSPICPDTQYWSPRPPHGLVLIKKPSWVGPCNAGGAGGGLVKVSKGWGVVQYG